MLQLRAMNARAHYRTICSPITLLTVAAALAACGGPRPSPEDSGSPPTDAATPVGDATPLDGSAPQDAAAQDTGVSVDSGVVQDTGVAQDSGATGDAASSDGGSCAIPPVTITHAGATSTPTIVRFLDQARYPNSVCNDGTPAAFFVRRGSGDASRRWVIYLEGGGSCLTPDGCAARPQELSSTAGIMRTDGQTVTQNLFGVLSSDAAVNPDFYDANVVLLNYCSSDLWSGDVGATPGAPAGDIRRFHFRGKRIVRSVIAELVRSHGLNDAREVFFMGSSAGGAGTLANIDETRTTLATVPRFIGMIDGAYGVEYPAYDPATGRESAAGPAPTGPSITQRFAAWNPVGDASCIARFGAMNIECNIASRLLATDEISTPLFVVDSQMDSNQLGDFGVNNPGNANMQAFAQRYAAAKRAVFPTLRPQYGLFSLFSTTHVLMNKRDAWSSRVGATTLPAAIGQWYRDPCARTVRVIDTP